MFNLLSPPILNMPPAQGEVNDALAVMRGQLRRAFELLAKDLQTVYNNSLLYVLRDGTRDLTNNWDAGSFEIRSRRIYADTELQIAALAGVLKATAGVVSGGSTTTDLPEGTNLYFTDERVDDRVAGLLVAGAGISLVYNDPANTLTVTSTITQYTDEMAQDTIGGALLDTASIDFTYNDVANQISAAVIPGGVDHDALFNFVANEHIDWTNAAVNLKTSGSVQCQGVLLYDTNKSNYLNLFWNEDDVLDRALTLLVNAANRIINLSGNLVVEATATLNQDLTTDYGPTFDDLYLYDTDASHKLLIHWNENLAANRTLNLLVGAADRTITLGGNLTVELASIINQDVTSDADVTFNSIVCAGGSFISSGLGTAVRPNLDTSGLALGGGSVFAVANGPYFVLYGEANVGFPGLVKLFLNTDRDFIIDVAGTTKIQYDSSAAQLITSAVDLRVSNDTDAYSIFGRAAVGGAGAGMTADRAYFAHLDRYNSTDYAVVQLTGGVVSLNTKAGQIGYFQSGAVNYGEWRTAGLKLYDAKTFVWGTDTDADIAWDNANALLLFTMNTALGQFRFVCQDNTAVQFSDLIKFDDITAFPAAAVGYRGAFGVLFGGAMVADTVKACLKAAAGTYSWVTVATG